MDVARRNVSEAVLSSSPAFATPVHPVNTTRVTKPQPPVFRTEQARTAPILPVLIPPPSLRPLAFRIFTKKHNLTISASSLSALSTFIGRHCGSGWREDGTGERVLEEVAKLWKKENGGVIVDDGVLLKSVLKALEGFMNGGKVQQTKATSTLRRESTFNFSDDASLSAQYAPPRLERAGSSFGMSGLNMANGDEDEDESVQHPLAWFKVVSAFDQPRLTFDNDKKHYVQCTSAASAFPSITERARMSRERYAQIYHRLLRNPSFQEPAVSARGLSLQRQDTGVTAQQFYRITSITNLLGRGGTSHLLLGMLSLTPAGMLAIQDPSGSIALDLSNATPLQGKDSAYFVPGMIVLVDGLYEESWAGAGSSGLGNTSGVGGMIGGRFIGFSIGGPPVEKRDISLGINLTAGDTSGGLGWIDFLGQGSEKAVGEKMRKLEARLMINRDSQAELPRQNRAVIIGEIDLAAPSTLPALRAVLASYAAQERQLPTAFILTGNFSSQSALAGSGCGSIEYKNLFDSLAALLSEFPQLLRSCTWIFVPGDRDAWASAFSSGASTLIPRETVPDVFTSRVKRAFTTARSEVGPSKHDRHGELVWTSNPARISLFGPAHELVVFRDDVSGRFRRNALNIGMGLKGQHDSPMREDDNFSEVQAEQEVSGGLPDSAEAQMTTEDVPAAVQPQDVDRRAEEDYAIAEARKLVLSLLPQSTLSPFPNTIRPTHWSYQSSLSLYPLPHTLILVDAEAEPFAVTFEGCHVLNPGRLVGQGSRRKKAVWAEYDLYTKRGKIMDAWIS